MLPRHFDPDRGNDYFAGKSCEEHSVTFQSESTFVTKKTTVFKCQSTKLNSHCFLEDILS